MFEIERSTHLKLLFITKINFLQLFVESKFHQLLKFLELNQKLDISRATLHQRKMIFFDFLFF